MLRITDELVQEFKAFKKKASSFRLFRYYGMHKLANAHLGLPYWFPIDYLTYIEHGISHQMTMLGPRLEISKGEVVMLNNQARKNLALKAGKKNVFAIGALFIHYRMRNNIKQSPQAKGTISFPCHSTLDISTVFDWDKYARELSELPEEYHPISACVYWTDVLEGRHEAFAKYGISTFTCGHIGDKNYAKNLYETLKEYRYVTSNLLGSYANYALEMDIPFFIFGDESAYAPRGNKGDKIEYVNVAILSNPFYLEMTRSFEMSHKELLERRPVITAEQLSFQNQLVDKENWESPNKVRWTILLKLPLLVFQKIQAALFKKK